MPWVLKDATGPVMLSEIYRRIKIYKTGEGKTLPLKEEVDHEYAVRWALSNMRKPERGLVKNSTPGLGLWK